MGDFPDQDILPYECIVTPEPFCLNYHPYVHSYRGDSKGNYILVLILNNKEKLAGKRKTLILYSILAML